MADAKITALTANTTPAIGDLLALVDDPSGVPATQKITLENLLKVINGLTADASPDSAADYVVTYDASAGGAKKVLLNLIGGSGDGWTAGTGTWSYSSADDPTFVISINADVTALIGVGDRVKLTQTTAKYFIVTAVGAFGGGATLVTVYGGTDYDLANAAITSPYYSHVKAPFGFPVTPTKWSVSLSDTSLQTQATPTQNTWYNPGTLSLSMPIGVWRVRWKVFLQAGDASAVNVGCQCTMSTANNSESDADMTTYSILTVPAGSTMGIPINISKIVTVTVKTAQYLNARTISAGLDNLYFANNAMGLILTFECAYL